MRSLFNLRDEKTENLRDRVVRHVVPALEAELASKVTTTIAFVIERVAQPFLKLDFISFKDQVSDKGSLRIPTELELSRWHR